MGLGLQGRKVRRELGVEVLDEAQDHGVHNPAKLGASQLPDPDQFLGLQQSRGGSLLD
jgi:hypothetical protein